MVTKPELLGGVRTTTPRLDHNCPHCLFLWCGAELGKQLIMSEEYSWPVALEFAPSRTGRPATEARD